MPTPSRCDVCGAPVSAPLMVFHRDWHASQDGRGRQFWEAPVDPPVQQMLELVAALQALPRVRARPAFVAGLRARLTEHMRQLRSC